MSDSFKGLDRLQTLVEKSEKVDPASHVFKTVNDMSDYSVKKTLTALLRQIIKEVEDEKFTSEGNRFLLMAVSGNYIQLD